MADIYSPEKRSEVMSRVRSKETRLELRVRSALHRMGYRFRVHVDNLPGRPDVVLPRHRKVLFINGCFWHQHPECARSKRPKSNAAWWQRKLKRNVQRDREARKALLKLGWSCHVLWECVIARDQSLMNKLGRIMRA